VLGCACRAVAVGDRMFAHAAAEVIAVTSELLQQLDRVSQFRVKEGSDIYAVGQARAEGGRGIHLWIQRVAHDGETARMERKYMNGGWGNDRREKQNKKAV
jgi:hypothetical protein